MGWPPHSRCWGCRGGDVQHQQGQLAGEQTRRHRVHKELRGPARLVQEEASLCGEGRDRTISHLFWSEAASH